jgi:hypothetical protein
MAHNATRGYTRKDVESLYSPIQQHGIRLATETLDGTNTSEIFNFGDISDKISMQASGDLDCAVDVTVNGSTWIEIAASITSAAIVTYSTHVVTAVRVRRTSGTGKLHLVGSI